MRSAGFADGARARLRLLLGVVAVVLSLLAMHQLSSNHTAADPTAADAIAPTAPVQVVTVGLGSAPLDLEDRHHTGAADEGHTHLGALPGDGHLPAPESGGCSGCGDHSAMALTCLAALVLLMTGWVLTRPAAWRGLRLRRWLPMIAVLRSSWLPPPRSLVELSISRT